MTNFLATASGIALAATAIVSSIPIAPPNAAVTAASSVQTAVVVSASTDPTISMSGAGDDEYRRFDEAVQRFRDHDLDLPDLDVRFYDDDSECQGHYGLFQTSFTPWRITICSPLEFVPTHELAHAWEAANLDDAARADYLEHRDLATWNDDDHPWMERGIEDAAVTMQKNLMAFDLPMSATWRERVFAYELLTGQPSPVHQ